MGWVFEAAAPDDVEPSEYLSARDRVLTFRLDDAHRCEFRLELAQPVDARMTSPGGPALWEIGEWDRSLWEDEFGSARPPTPEPMVLDDLAADVLCSRDGELMFRGRCGVPSGVEGVDEDSASLAAVSYRALLDRRIVLPGDEASVSFAQQPAGMIAWTLADLSQSRAGGNLLLQAGSGCTYGPLRDRTYDVGKSCGEAIAELGRVGGGFDWDVTAERSLVIWHEPNRRGRTADDGLVLELGGDVMRAERSGSPFTLANVVGFVGGVGTVPVVSTASGISGLGLGRWESWVSESDIVEQSTVEARSAFLARQLPPMGFRLQLRTNRWQGWQHVWLGDRFVFRGRRHEWLCRAVEIGVDVSDDGAERVTVAADVIEQVG